jgi:hypothetical protein
MPFPSTRMLSKDDITCLVCYDGMHDCDIVSCGNNHRICVRCWTKLTDKSCPQCRVGMSEPTTCTEFMEIVRKNSYGCPHKLCNDAFVSTEECVRHVLNDEAHRCIGDFNCTIVENTVQINGTGFVDYAMANITFQGTLVNGLRSGHGIMKFKTGTYEGGWKEDRMHGQGKETTWAICDPGSRFTLLQAHTAVSARDGASLHRTNQIASYRDEAPTYVEFMFDKSVGDAHGALVGAIATPRSRDPGSMGRDEMYAIPENRGAFFMHLQNGSLFGNGLCNAVSCGDGFKVGDRVGVLAKAGRGGFVRFFRNGEAFGHGFDYEVSDRDPPVNNLRIVVQMSSRSKGTELRLLPGARIVMSSYDGQWSNACPHGHGEHHHESGDVYVGQWRRGLMHGGGTLTMYNRTVYEGQWSEGSKWGRGKFTSMCGAVMKGHWEDDKLMIHDPFPPLIPSPPVPPSTHTLNDEDMRMLAEDAGLDVGELESADTDWMFDRPPAPPLAPLSPSVRAPAPAPQLPSTYTLSEEDTRILANIVNPM